MLQDAWPKPLYQTIKQYVVERIESGEWKPGTRIPSEAEIVKLLSASRMTVNRAIRELSEEGLVKRIPGVGTFVTQPRPRATLLHIRSIGDEITERGGVHSCEVVAQGPQQASDCIAQALEIAPGAPVFHVQLVHLEDDRPVQIENRCVNPAAAPEFLDQDFSAITPSEYLLGLLPVTEIEHNIEARPPSREECDLLRIPPSEACLELYRRSWSGRGVVTCVRLVNPGSIYSVGGRFRVGGAPHS